MKHLMDRYKTDSLVNYCPVTFERELRDMIGQKIQNDTAGQRDASVVFRWGHDHDFGTFKLEGRMHTRHIYILDQFNKEVDLVERVKGADVLDIGCWTGGESLLLAAMGAKRVVAIDEVAQYVSCLRFMADAFNVQNIFTLPKSLYDMNRVHNTRSFDVVYCAGVLYHLSDPLVGLRIMRNLLRPEGLLLLETAIHRKGHKLSMVEYLGPTRSGFNWWFPTADALFQMMADVGFYATWRIDKRKGNRACFIAKRSSVDVPFMQSGLSIPTP